MLKKEVSTLPIAFNERLVRKMSQEYGFHFEPEKCIQCHACEAACKSWRRTEPGIDWRWVRAVWSGDYPDVSLASLSMSCQHCIQPECVDVCPEDAIEKRAEDGVVVVDPQRCIGCQTCLDACPFDVPRFGTDDIMQKCDMCRPAADDGSAPPACVATCPTGALQYGLCDIDAKKDQEERLRQRLAMGKGIPVP